KVVMTDGAEREIGPGDAFYISPGHDAWVVGQETFVAILLGPLETAAARPVPEAEVAPPPVH
ncbi:MAG: cupin domain-containing protein, partial [Myxococcaceae bacterium]